MTAPQKAATRNVDEVAHLITANQALQAQVDHLQQQVDWFKKQFFGSKSERRFVDDNPRQLHLGEMEVAQNGVAPEVPTQKIEYTRRIKNRATSQDDESGLRFDDTVPVEVIELPNPELHGLSEGDYEVIGEKITHRIAQQPSSYVVLKYVRKVVKLKDNNHVLCPAAPASVIEKGYADVSFIAGMIIDKLVYHLPLYRQHQRLKQSGIEIARSTLTNTIHRVAPLLEPIYDAQLDSIRCGDHAALDETPIKAGQKGKGKMRHAYYWPLMGDQDEIAFLYSPSRAHRVVREVLGDFKGTLLTDGYAAYSQYAKRHDAVVHALCWAHTRRKFFDAQGCEPEPSTVALNFIGRLYEIEAQIKEGSLSDEKKRAYRVEHSKPVVAAFFAWAEQQLVDQALLPTNPLTQALGYALERKTGLEVFLTDPNVPLDTNHLERALRVIPMGRRNWLFCWTEIGAHYVGILQSLLSTCRLHNINPYDYLVDVLQRIDTHPASRVHELTPRLWKEKFADNPLRSPLYHIRRELNNGGK